MKNLILFSLTLILVIALVAPPIWSMNHMRSTQPYGGYCRGMKWGWYGASRAVNTVNDARSLLEEFLKETELKVGEIKDEGNFFKADINDKDGIRADILIVDKRSARIRSAY